MIKAPAISVLTLWLLLLGCTKESDDARFSTTPRIALTQQSSTALVGFADTLTLTLSYEDGDGDLGGFDGSSMLFVLDQRLDEPDAFALQQLTPNGEALSIEGTLLVKLGPYFVLGNAPAEAFVVECWLTDRAGNESNHIETEAITVARP